MACDTEIAALADLRRAFDPPDTAVQHDLTGTLEDRHAEIDLRNREHTEGRSDFGTETRSVGFPTILAPQRLIRRLGGLQRCGDVGRIARLDRRGHLGGTQALRNLEGLQSLSAADYGVDACSGVDDEKGDSGQDENELDRAKHARQR